MRAFFCLVLGVMVLVLHAQQPGIQLQIQPGSGPVIIGPGGTIHAPGSEEVEPAASAVFEPEFGRVGRPMEYRVTITGSQRVLDLPEPASNPPGLEITPAGRSLSTTPMQGGLAISTTLRYMVMAPREGTYTIPGRQVMVGTKLVRIPSATVLVQAPQSGEALYQPVLAVLDLPQRDFFVGEVINARVLLLETRDETPQYVAHVSKTSGGLVFRPEMRTRREEIIWQGRPTGALVMPVEITPISEGEIEVSCEMVVHVQKLDANGRRSGFTMQQNLTTQKVRLRSVPLPEEGRLPGFSGAIGKMQFSKPTLSADQVEVGEPLMLTVSVTGEGNLEGVTAPEPKTTDAWQAYRPASQFVRGGGDNGASMKTWTYTLMPRMEGQRSTPPMTFAYFDPIQRRYFDATIPPMPVLVKPSSVPLAAVAGTALTASPGAQPEPPKEIAPALTGLAEVPGTWHSGLTPALWSRWFWWSQAIIPTILLALWAWRKRQDYVAAHPHHAVRKQARRAARRALAAARAAASRGDREAFFAAGLGALREAAAPLDSAKAHSLTPQEVLSKLAQDDRRVVEALFNSAECVRYAPGSPDLPAPTTLMPALERAVQRLFLRI